jgi:hypothetical protein
VLPTPARNRHAEREPFLRKAGIPQIFCRSSSLILGLGSDGQRGPQPSMEKV